MCDFDLPEWHQPPIAPYTLPADVGASNNRIDAFIVSRKARILIAGPELTVPMEENADRQHSIKLERYKGMASDLHGGWRLLGPLCLEMGCRGVDPPSFHDVLRQLAFSSSEIRQLRGACAYIARYCSYLIWLSRYNRNFFCPRVYWANGKVLTDHRSMNHVTLERSGLPI
jgi:hypothetical protein